MPSRPLSPCLHPGCSTLIERGTGRCPIHRKTHARAVESTRLTAHARGYDGEWQQARMHYLMAHPICTQCGAAASVVDHITPHRGDMRLFWSVENWQPMCKPCHDRKTHTIDGGFDAARARGRAD